MSKNDIMTPINNIHQCTEINVAYINSVKYGTDGSQCSRVPLWRGLISSHDIAYNTAVTESSF